MRKILSLLLILLALSQINAQESSENNFNLPPGFVFGKKEFVYYDLSYKIDDKINNLDYKDADLKVAKSFTESELEAIKKTDIITFNYYNMANEYFNMLSSKVKNLYTKNELWYVYIFDPKLKERLLKIK